MRTARIELALSAWKAEVLPLNYVRVQTNSSNRFYSAQTSKTVAHIDAALKQFNEGGISELLTGDIAAKAAYFNTQTAPGLTKKLVDVLKSKN